MLTVYNLPAEPSLLDPLRDNRQLLLVLAVWAVVMLAVAGMKPSFDTSAWYLVHSADASVFYDRQPDEATCKAVSADARSVCVSGTELSVDGAASARMAQR